MKVLITGASGHMATLAMPGLEGRHELRLADVRAPARMPSGATFEAISLLDASDAELTALFRDIEVVIHSAYIHSGGGEVYSPQPPQIERFDVELDNIRMSQRVYRHALEAGVRRVVMVSSNHAADWYEHNQVHRRQKDMVYPTDLPLVDNFYGWAKASTELLGHPYACGVFGRRLEVVMLRIGSPYPIDVRKYEPGAAPQISSLTRPKGRAAFKRALGAYLSDRDTATLFRAALESKLALPEDAVPWVIAYGISDNTRAFWSLESARRVLGYAPQDDSELIHAADVQRLLMNGDPEASGRLGSGTA